MKAWPVRPALAAALVALSIAPGARHAARATEQNVLMDALVKGVTIETTAMPTDPVGRFQAEIINFAVPAARTLHISFQADGAQSLLDYTASGPIVDALKTPTRPAQPLVVRNEQRFVALALAHADDSPAGLMFTARSVEKLKATIRQASSWFCPCWPFCK